MDVEETFLLLLNRDTRNLTVQKERPMSNNGNREPTSSTPHSMTTTSSLLTMVARAASADAERNEWNMGKLMSRGIREGERRAFRLCLRCA